MWVDERSSANTNTSTKGEESGSEGEMDVEADNRSKIAWRYGGMEKFKTSIGRSNVCLGVDQLAGILTVRRERSIEPVDLVTKIDHRTSGKSKRVAIHRH